VANVLFLCIGNAGRSQMAHAFLERLGGHEVRSAGSRAESRLHPEVVEAMRELGLDVADRQPRRLTTDLAAEADAVITMGCGDACPVIPGKKQLRADWDLADPKDRPLEEVRATRDDIDRRVGGLIAELDAA
jgi:arsenate reductase (thioredoxin)